LVISKEFKEMMHMMESLTVSINETFDKTTTSMNEMFHKSQASTETILERMQRGIAAMSLTQMLLQLTHMLTMIHSLKIQRLTIMSTPSFLILLHANVDPSTNKVWEVIKITTTNTMFATMILLLKLNFLSLLLMARMMLRLIYIGR
jgi:hypothetical protein